MNQCFNQPEAREILESKTSKYDKIRALHSLSSNVYCAHFLARHYQTTEVAIRTVLAGSESEMPFYDEDNRHKLRRVHLKGNVSATTEHKLVYV